MDAANENLIGNEQINNEPQEELGELALEEVTDNAGRLVAEGTKDNAGEPTVEGVQGSAGELTVEEVRDNAAADSKKKKKVKVHASFAKNIVSVVFFTLALVLGIAAGMLYFVREALDSYRVEEAVHNMTIGDIGIGVWYGQEGQDITLDEYITDVFNSSGAVSVQQKDIKKLLDSRFVKNFTADLFNGYIADFLYGTGEGCIDIQNIMTLLDNNWDEISSVTGIEAIQVEGMTQEDIRMIVLDGVRERLVRDIHFDSFTFSGMRRQYPFVLNVLSTAVTYPVIIFVVAVAALLLLMILFMNIRYCGGFRYVGNCFCIIGIVNLAAAVAMYVLPVVLNEIFGLGYDFYISLFTLQVMRALYIGAAFVVCGIILSTFGKIIRSVRRRILRRKLT